MNERRQAFKREPIEVELAPGDIFLVDPIPWEQRNLFGDEVVRQNVELLNESVRIYIDEASGAPQLEAKMAEKFSDYRRLFELGLSESAWAAVKGKQLYSNQVVEILLAICDVNDLSRLRPILDPNSTTPTKLGGMLSELMSTPPGESTQKIESGPDSSPQELTEEPSEPLLTPS